MTDDLLQALQDSLRDRGVPIRTTPPVIVADRETAEALHPMVGRTYPDVETALDALVAASGGTLSGVAEILAAAGIRGFCTDANRCALAQWLLTVVDGDLRGDVEVQPCDGEVGEVSWGDVEIVSCTLPPLLNRFASAFDEGAYPALIHEDSVRLRGAT